MEFKENCGVEVITYREDINRITVEFKVSINQFGLKLDLDINRITVEFKVVFRPCKCQYKNDQKVENKNVHFPRSIPQLVFP